MDGIAWFVWFVIVAFASAAFAVGHWKQGKRLTSAYMAGGSIMCAGAAYWVTTIEGFL